jgi:NAD+ synthase (glutamine-hydrolysing)
MKIFLAQINPKVGDFEQNFSKISHACENAFSKTADLIVFSECVLTGYPAQDLWLCDKFIETVHSFIQRLIRVSENYPTLAIAIGTPFYEDNALYNSLIVILKGALVFKQHKQNLPNYDVFDEKRYFKEASVQTVFLYKDQCILFSICEDAWAEYEGLSKENKSLYIKTVEEATSLRPSVFINISASPFDVSKQEQRRAVFSRHAKTLNCPVIMVNQVGGNDQLIFDGASMLLSKEGELIFQLASFKEDFMLIDTANISVCSEFLPCRDPIQLYHDALVLGIRDYVQKTGFKKVILGLSGGIDSALTAVLAVRALGSENVRGLAMPSHYSSQGSIDDALDLAKNLGIRCDIVPIQDFFDSALNATSPLFEDYKTDLTEENMQARLRGLILMALANKTQALVLSTGNKSELAMGYCTLYGDMCGAICVLGDLYKTDVYHVSEYVNKHEIIIPLSTLTKEPSAELRPNQKDSDSLPPYEILDRILSLFIDENQSESDILKLGFDRTLVKDILKKIHNNEYKRQQAAPSLKLSRKSFGLGRRFSIAANFFSS